MTTYTLQARDSDIFKTFTLSGDEVVKLTYSRQIDDIMINADGGDILVQWDNHEWGEDAMLIKDRDFKEIGGINCTHFLVKSKNGSKVTVYTVAQLN